MYLISPDYVAPEATVKPKVKDVKTKIKTFVGEGKKSYEEIVKHIQEADNLTNDEVISQIKEINLEWNPNPIKDEPVIEE